MKTKNLTFQEAFNFYINGCTIKPQEFQYPILYHYINKDKTRSMAMINYSGEDKFIPAVIEANLCLLKWEITEIPDKLLKNKKERK